MRRDARKTLLILKLPDLIYFFYELFRSLSAKKIYLADGTGRLNISKLLRLIKNEKLEDKFKKLCTELDYKATSDKGLAACLKQLIRFLSEYSVGIFMLEKTIREEEVLTESTIKKIVEELMQDYIWYKEEIKRLLEQQRINELNTAK